MTAPVRIGLIGAGRIGQVHAANIASNPDSVLAWVSDPVVAGAQAVAARYGALASDDADSVLASGDVDAIVIASPTPTHVGLISAAIDAGVAALCEKPIDLDITRVDELRGKVAASSVPIALGFNRRFDSHFAAARARVQAGEIGALEHLSIISRDPEIATRAYLAQSGGIFRDMTIHDFDMARFFVPDIVAVSALGSNLFSDNTWDLGDFDSAVVTLRSSEGKLVSITNSRHAAYGYDQRIEAFGSKGLLSVANAPSSLVSLTTGAAVEARPRYQDFFLERYAGAYVAELDAFIRLVRGEASTSPTFEDGRAALVLADAAERSARSGAVVEVDLG